MEGVGDEKFNFPLLNSAKHQKSHQQSKVFQIILSPMDSLIELSVFFNSLMVVFYVKDKVSKARDGYEVAGLLKEKIGNEEGFFEFGLLKVEPYSKYMYSLHNRRYFFRIFQAIEGKREVSEEHQTRATGDGRYFFCAFPVARV